VFHDDGDDDAAAADDDDDDDDVFSLSDVLIAVTDNSSHYNISDKMAEAGFETDKTREFSLYFHWLYNLTVISFILMFLSSSLSLLRSTVRFVIHFYRS